MSENCECGTGFKIVLYLLLGCKYPNAGRVYTSGMISFLIWDPLLILECRRHKPLRLCLIGQCCFGINIRIQNGLLSLYINVDLTKHGMQSNHDENFRLNMYIPKIDKTPPKYKTD